MADGGVTPLLPLAARVGLGVRSASVGRAGWVVVLRTAEATPELLAVVAASDVPMYV